MRGILILLTLAGSLLFAEANAQTYTTMTIGWNPSPTPGIAGYYLYYGTASGDYTGVVAINNAATTNVTIRGLISGTTYYFAAASYTSDGTESDLSPEISGVAGATISTSPGGSLTSDLMSGGHFGFTVSGTGTGLYIVQASTNLVNWVNLMTNTGGSFNFVDSNASQFSHRFYRTAYQSAN